LGARQAEPQSRLSPLSVSQSQYGFSEKTPIFLFFSAFFPLPPAGSILIARELDDSGGVNGGTSTLEANAAKIDEIWVVEKQSDSAGSIQIFELIKEKKMDEREIPNTGQSIMHRNSEENETRACLNEDLLPYVSPAVAVPKDPLPLSTQTNGPPAVCCCASSC